MGERSKQRASRVDGGAFYKVEQNTGPLAQLHGFESGRHFINGENQCEIADSTAKWKNTQGPCIFRTMLPCEKVPQIFRELGRVFLDCKTERIWIQFPIRCDNEGTI
jgi:hypothetical protein